MWPICAICLSVVGDQMLGPILEILVLPQRSFTFHTLQRKSTNFDAYLLWGSCEIGVFILPIKTILSELFRLDWALDCEWRDLKLETNFVLRNFYYLWKSSYMNIGFFYIWTGPSFADKINFHSKNILLCNA